MTVTRRRLVHLIGLVTLLGVSGATARAHDLAEASAALVVRDGGHLELRLQVPWAALLQADRMPGRPLPEFLMYVSAMSPSTFDGHYRRLVARLERAFRLTRPAAAPVTFQRWVWPRSAAVQQAVQRELMSRLADGGARCTPAGDGRSGSGGRRRERGARGARAAHPAAAHRHATAGAVGARGATCGRGAVGDAALGDVWTSGLHDAAQPQGIGEEGSGSRGQ